MVVKRYTPYLTDKYASWEASEHSPSSPLALVTDISTAMWKRDITRREDIGKFVEFIIHNPEAYDPELGGFATWEEFVKDTLLWLMKINDHELADAEAELRRRGIEV